jgi:hypothetical protein
MIYKKSSPHFIAAVTCFIFFSLSSPVASAQDFSSIDNDLQTLENFYANSDPVDGGN